MRKNATRQLNESSWLAQSLVDMMEFESSFTGRFNSIHTLKIIVNEADGDNDRIYYENRNGKLYIIVGDIPSCATREGTDFDREGMRNRMRGMAARYSGVYTLTTHDLNSATINVSEVMEQMRQGQ